MMILDDRRKIGIGLTAVGVLFLLLGVLFLFDSAMLAMGNVLFLSGVALTIGPRATLQFFTKRRNFRGSGAFLGGFLLVLIGWAVTGMAAQSYGFLLLFADFLPTALPFARRVPVVGYLLSLPPVRAATNKLVSLAKGKDRLPV